MRNFGKNTEVANKFQCLVGLQPSNRSQIVAVSSRDHVRSLTTIWGRFPISTPSIGGGIVSEVVDFVSKSTVILDHQICPFLQQFCHGWKDWRSGIDPKLLPDLGRALYSKGLHSGHDFIANQSHTRHNACHLPIFFKSYYCVLDLISDSELRKLLEREATLKSIRHALVS